MAFRGRPFPSELSVGEVAARSGVAISALHFYETRGLITSRRNAGNQRRYAREVLRRIAVIKAGQRVGIPLSVIARALEQLPQGQAPTARDWQAFSSGWRSELQQRIDQLERLRDQLDRCIGCGCLSLDTCPIYNCGDLLAARGPGAHYLNSD